ncbi:hypothetical protein LZ32DRAFT_351453 [Colletotrichum eremochloae]|nr:hypothetical protein LZ32DRAFT_351453 [Colletotrichum eremochloae]
MASGRTSLPFTSLFFFFLNAFTFLHSSHFFLFLLSFFAKYCIRSISEPQTF